MDALALARVPAVEIGTAAGRQLEAVAVRQPENIRDAATKKPKKDKRDKKAKRSVVVVVAGAAQSLSSPASSATTTTGGGGGAKPAAFEAFPVLRLKQADYLSAMKHRHPPPQVRIRRNYPFLGVHSVRAVFYEEQQLGVRFKARAGRIVVDRLNRQFNQPGLAERQGVEVGDVVAEVNGIQLDLVSGDGDGGSGGGADDDGNGGRRGIDGGDGGGEDAAAAAAASACDVARRVKEDFRRLSQRPLELVLWRFEQPYHLALEAAHVDREEDEEEEKEEVDESPPPTTTQAAAASAAAAGRGGQRERARVAAAPARAAPAIAGGAGAVELPPSEQLTLALRHYYEQHNPAKVQNVPAIVGE
jgi:hypothetical protein